MTRLVEHILFLIAGVDSGGATCYTYKCWIHLLFISIRTSDFHNNTDLFAPKMLFSMDKNAPRGYYDNAVFTAKKA